jgi:hypothetical protein
MFARRRLHEERREAALWIGKGELVAMGAGRGRGEGGRTHDRVRRFSGRIFRGGEDVPGIAVARDTRDADRAELGRRIPHRIGLRRVAAAAKGQGLDGEGAAVDRIVVGLLVQRGAPFRRDVRVAALATRVLLGRAFAARHRRGPGHFHGLGALRRGEPEEPGGERGEEDDPSGGHGFALTISPVRRSMRMSRFVRAGLPQRSCGVEPLTPSCTAFTSFWPTAKLGTKATK